MLTVSFIRFPYAELPFYSYNVFIMKRRWILSNVFSLYVEMIIWFLSFILLIWFSYVKSIFHFCNKSYSVMVFNIYMDYYAVMSWIYASFHVSCLIFQPGYLTDSISQLPPFVLFSSFILDSLLCFGFSGSQPIVLLPPWLFCLTHWLLCFLSHCQCAMWHYHLLNVNVIISFLHHHKFHVQLSSF